MSEDLKKLDISNDQPKIAVADDALEYSDFAKKVADTIIALENQDSLVMSINAPWGYGKTTCLNFIEQHLNKNENIKVIKFNPWVISENKDDIILKFLHMLGGALRDMIYEDEIVKTKKDLPASKGAISEKIGRNGWSAGKRLWGKKESPKIAELKVIWKGLLGALSSTAVEELDKIHNDLDVQKDKLNALLQKNGKRLVVFIDDLDRLTKDETKQVFRLVKAIADFNFITYIVAFDHTIVSSALDNEFCDNGYSYLNKIVQIPLTLPKIYQDDLDNLFFTKIDKILNAINYEINEEKRGRFYTLNKVLIKQHIRTPREINRLLNGFIINFMQVPHDVDFIDFLTIEILRIYEPELYFEIRDNLDLYVASRAFMANHKYKAYFTKISEKFPDRVEFIKEIFPRTSEHLGGPSYGSGWEDGWNTNKRICSAKRAYIYFGLRLEEGEVSDSELLKFLESVKMQNDLDNAILVWADEKLKTGRSKLFYWIPKLTTLAQTIHKMGLTQIFISSIFKFKDSFCDCGDADYSHLIGVDNNLRFRWLYNEIMKNVKDEQTRFEIIKNAASESNNLTAVAEFMMDHAISHGLVPDMKDQVAQTITKEHYLEIEKMFLDKISDNKAKIHEYAKPMRLLQFMRSRAEETYNASMKHYVESGEEFIILLEGSYGNVSSSSKGVFPIINTWAITPYISDDEIIKKLEDIKKNTPALAERIEKLIKDIPYAKKFRNTFDTDDDGDEE